MRGVYAVALLAAALVSVAPAAQPLCSQNAAATPGLQRLRAAMAQGRFVAYEPTSLQTTYGHSTQADPDSIRADLKVLRPRFDSLITYDSIHGAEAIPAIAASLGFRALIIGIWNPFDEKELSAALTAAKDNPAVVIGLSPGNEMLFFHRHSAADLVGLLDTVHAREPQLLLTTTEPFQMFEAPEAAPILQRLDFLLANVHPVFQPWFRTAPDTNAAEFVTNVVSDLGARFCGPILVKETGEPTAPEEKGFTQKRQATFYEELQRRFPASGERAFAYFAAFDAPWRVNDNGAAPEEAHWGLFDEQRRPKPVVALIPPLTSPSRSSPSRHD